MPTNISEAKSKIVPGLPAWYVHPYTINNQSDTDCVFPAIVLLKPLAGESQYSLIVFVNGHTEETFARYSANYEPGTFYV